MTDEERVAEIRSDCSFLLDKLAEAERRGMERAAGIAGSFKIKSVSNYAATIEKRFSVKLVAAIRAEAAKL